MIRRKGCGHALQWHWAKIRQCSTGMVQRLLNLLPMRNATHRASVFGHEIGKKHRRRADIVDVAMLLISKKLLVLWTFNRAKRAFSITGSVAV